MPFIAPPSLVTIADSPLTLARQLQTLTQQFTVTPLVRSATPIPAIAPVDSLRSRPEFSTPRSVPLTPDQIRAIDSYRLRETYRTAPQMGSQLYVQRFAALQVGKLYTQLPSDSFQEVWQQASRQPNHEQWKTLLAMEADAIATRQGDQKLSVLLGDSLSLWLPPKGLPAQQIWLNQGISGDTTQNILGRLTAFNQTRPQTIYLMAGVNDLKRGAGDLDILLNLHKIIRRLKAAHPHSRIIVQSILPTRSPLIPNARIPELNRSLAAIAKYENVTYLDLHSQFVDRDGQIISAYTTDGIHLNAQGYAVWQRELRQNDLRLSSQF